MPDACNPTLTVCRTCGADGAFDGVCNPCWERQQEIEANPPRIPRYPDDADEEKDHGDGGLGSGRWLLGEEWDL